MSQRQPVVWFQRISFSAHLIRLNLIEYLSMKFIPFVNLERNSEHHDEPGRCNHKHEHEKVESYVKIRCKRGRIYVTNHIIVCLSKKMTILGENL